MRLRTNSILIRRTAARVQERHFSPIGNLPVPPPRMSDSVRAAMTPSALSSSIADRSA
jgi:hypothetical protein